MKRKVTIIFQNVGRVIARSCNKAHNNKYLLLSPSARFIMRVGYEHNGERIMVDLPDSAAHDAYETASRRLWRGITRLNTSARGDDAVFRQHALAWLRNSSAFHRTYQADYVPSDVRHWTEKLRAEFSINDAQFLSGYFAHASNGGDAIDCGGADEDVIDADWALAISFENIHGMPACVINDVSSVADNGCANCGKKVDDNSMCSRCSQVMYCSVDCQHEHWKEHKKNCMAACANCGMRSETNLRCCRCKRTCYCKKECQEQHWEVHKKTCKAPKKGNN